jgi:pilus assembly protein CpaC
MTSEIHAKGNRMTIRLTHTLLSAAAAIAIPAIGMGASAATAQTVTRPNQDVAVSIGRGQLITVPGRMADVFVANEAVADVQIKSPNQLYLMGKGGGVTTVYASDAQGNVIWSANVRVGTNIDSVDQMLRVAMPEAKVVVSTIGSDTVLLTGTVAAPEDASEAQRLVAAYMGKTANVISRLKMATPLQVNLLVRIAEVSRTLTKSLTSNLSTADSTSGFKFGVGQGTTGSQWTPGGPMGVNVTSGATGTTVVAAAAGGTTLAGAGRLFGLDILGTLDAGETAGLVTTLAQPNLTALSGQTADFLAGGQFPYLVSQGVNSPATVQFKNYGVSLSYTPTVLANGRISLRVRPEVSELGDTVKQGGYDIPSLVTRSVETSVELGSGQSFMIAGLLRNSATNTVTKLPGAGDIPILGALFRSNGFKRGETELVIVVTPYLVQPVDANSIKLPTDGYQSPDDVKRIFGFQQSDGKTGGDRPKPHEAPATQQSAPPAPKVGDAAAAAPALAGGELPATKGKKPNADTQPGFNLK